MRAPEGYCFDQYGRLRVADEKYTGYRPDNGAYRYRCEGLTKGQK